jgi:hypothetical protein
MKYLLVLGFACDVYRKEPHTRIFFGDKFIDEFHIKNFKDNLLTARENFLAGKHVLQPYSSADYLDNISKNLPPIRFYEIDLDQIKNQDELRIEIKNADSNYNNGFMTCSTVVKLQTCYFFPLDKKLICRLADISKKKIFKQNYAQCRKQKRGCFDLTQRALKWHGENGTTLDSKDTVLKHYKIGGNGYFSCKFIKKYEIFIPEVCKSYSLNLFTIWIDYFIHKYEQYAHKRNFH